MEGMMFARENFRDVGKKISDWKREWLFWKVSIMLGKYFFDLQEKLFCEIYYSQKPDSFQKLTGSFNHWYSHSSYTYLLGFFWVAQTEHHLNVKSP